MLTYLEIARRLRPRWVVWENVPGVLSSNGGRDFGSFLGAMGELGYGVAYRVLDAQWCRTHGHPRAVPQRRRRVFVVGCLGDWERAAQVLFECESVQRDSAPRRTTRQGAASDAEGCAGTVSSKWAKGTGGPAGDECYNLIAQPVPYDLFQITAPVNRQNRKPGDPCHTLARDNAAHAAVVGTDCYNGAITGDVAATMGTTGSGVNGCGPTVMAFHPFQDPILSTDGSTHCMGTGGSQGHASIAVAFTDAGQGQRIRTVDESSETLRATKRGPFTDYYQAMTVRRLLPVECERLQAFPDDWTLIPWRKKPAHECPDGPRYKALGNSMAVNCMAWIGERIAAVEELQ